MYSNSSNNIVLITTGMTLFGVIIGGTITGVFQYFSTKIQSDMESRKYCIQRIDKNEDQLRLGSEKFLSSIGNLISITSIKKINTQQDIDKAISPIVVSGFSLSAYAPAKLNVVIFKTIQSALLAANASSPILQEEAINSVNESFGKWPTTYQEVLIELENQKRDCE